LHVACDFHADDKAKIAEDCLDELDQYPSLENSPVIFELRDDEPAIPQLGVY